MPSVIARVLQVVLPLPGVKKMKSENAERFIRFLRIVAAVLGSLFLVLAAIGSRWEANPLWSAKDRILATMIGLLFAASAVLGPKFVSAYKATAVILLNTFFLAVGLELTSAVIETIHNSDDEDKEVKNEKIASRPIQQKHAKEFTQIKPQYEPFVLWTEIPYKGETITINEKGLRNTPGSKCEKGAYTVFNFGGSAMWGAGAPDSETIPAILAALLREQMGKPVCVMNYAQNSYVVGQNIEQLMNLLLLGERPELIIFYDGYNDVYTAYEQGRAHRDFYYKQMKKTFQPEEQHWFQILTLYWRIHPAPPESYQWKDYSTMGIKAEDLSEAVANHYFNAYEVVKALAKEWQFDFALFIQPALSMSGKTLTQAERPVKDDISEPLARLTQMTYNRLKAGTEKRHRLFYLGNVFDDVTGDIWFDAVHVAPEGNRIVAERIINVLNKEGIIAAANHRAIRQ